jgi:hypothetical protein
MAVGDVESALFGIELEQVDHGLAAVAALAVDMLEEMQRQRSRTVEQQSV